MRHDRLGSTTQHLCECLGRRVPVSVRFGDLRVMPPVALDLLVDGGTISAEDFRNPSLGSLLLK